MFKKIKNSLKNRWEKVSSKNVMRCIFISYCIIAILFYICVKFTLPQEIEMILAIIVASGIVIPIFLINPITEKEMKERINKMLTDEPVQIEPRNNNSKQGLSAIFISLQKKLDGKCEMEAYMEEDGTIAVVLFVNNTFDDIFYYTDYELFMKEWKLKR